MKAFALFTDYVAYASSVGEDPNKVSLPNEETFNKEAGDLQEDGENPTGN